MFFCSFFILAISETPSPGPSNYTDNENIDYVDTNNAKIVIGSVTGVGIGILLIIIVVVYYINHQRPSQPAAFTPGKRRFSF